jgi:eukaryotic-like serine/threonine-protein kinase
MIGQTISHYKILSKLGEGGMGVVYKAEDLKLTRIVALKFLPHGLDAHEPERARFLQEARAAAILNHPNICTVYDIQEHDGQQFIVMEYVEGKTLREIVPVKKMQDAIGYVIQIAEALQEAHTHGIVHRDIKAENIVVNSKNQVKVMDFGLAKLKGSLKLTRTSSTVGTLAYMAPEQIQGGEVDARSDIFSFGVVLYEMFTGHLPFRGEHEAAVMYAIMNEDPQPFARLRSDVPRGVVTVLEKALQKDPLRRYESMKEAVSDLRSATALTVELPKQEMSIVVLPFDDLSANRDQEYFSDGLTEEIITDLSHVRALRVISRSSAMTFKGTKKTIPEIARSLNVQHVLEGSVRKSGNSLRITAQLIDAASDTHIWAEKYAGTLDDIFAIQEKVAQAIVDALKVQLGPVEHQRMGKRVIDNYAAYECYLRARHDIFSFTEEGLDRALKYLKSALQIVGDNAALHAGMAMALFQKVNMGFGQEETLGSAKEHAEKALSIDPTSAQGHAARAFIRICYGEFLDSLKDLKLAYEGDPSDSNTVIWLAFGYIIQGKPEAATALVERAIEINPIDANGTLVRGALLFCQGRFREAAEEATHAFKMDPDSTMNRFWSALTLAYAGNTEEVLALEASASVQSATDGLTGLVRLLAFALRGEKERFSEFLTDDFVDTIRRDFQYSYHVASFLAKLEMTDQSLGWLENAVNVGFFNYPLLAKIDPWLDNIRGEERFKNLMKRVKKDWEEFEV